MEGTSSFVEWNSTTATEKVQRLTQDIADRVDAVINLPAEAWAMEIKEEATPEPAPQPAV